MTDEASLAEKIFGGSPPPAEHKPDNATALTGPAKSSPAEGAPKPSEEAAFAARIFKGPEKHIDMFARKGAFARTDEAKPGDEEANKGDAGKPKDDVKPGDGEAKGDAGNTEPVNLAEAAEDLGLDTADPAFEPFAEVAGDLKLDKAGVEKLVKFDQERTVAAWDKIEGDWRSEAEKSPTFTSDVASAQGVLRRYGDATLVAELERFKLGSNPSIIHFLGRVGKALGY